MKSFTHNRYVGHRQNMNEFAKTVTIKYNFTSFYDKKRNKKVIKSHIRYFLNIYNFLYFFFPFRYIISFIRTQMCPLCLCLCMLKYPSIPAHECVINYAWFHQKQETNR